MPRSNEEHRAQRALFEWASYAQVTHPELRWMHAVPNGGDRHPAVGAKMKAEGVKRGVLDVFLDVARGGYHGLRIEMKAAKGRTSKEQREWIAHYERNGYCAAVCRSFDEARERIITYLKGETWRTDQQHRASDSQDC